MFVMRTRLRSLIAALVCITAASSAAAQDTFARARDLYASAAYDEALAVLDRLHENAPAAEAADIAGYRVFCLLALGRSDDARAAIERIVKADPLYHPSEANASPRTRAFFEDVRRALLPAIIKETYERGKTAFDNKDMTTATAAFDRVVSLLKEPGVADLPGVVDLSTLAAGFRDLSRAAAAPAPPPTPAEPKLSPRIPVRDPAQPYTSEDLDVIAPAAIARTMPIWNPESPLETRRDFRGALELVVDETGSVVSAMMRKGAHPRYDGALLQKARTWRFRPATKQGVPVKYRMIVEVHLQPSQK